MRVRDPDLVGLRARVLPVGQCRVLVDGAAALPRQVALQEQRQAVLEPGHAHLDEVGVEPRLGLEARVDLERHVGVECQQPIGRPAGQREGAAARLAEVREGDVVEGTGNALQRPQDDRLCVIRRSGVNNDPMIDVWPDGCQCSADALGFVLDDHHEAEAHHA
jgi:hypothetical protein